MGRLAAAVWVSYDTGGEYGDRGDVGRHGLLDGGRVMDGVCQFGLTTLRCCEVVVLPIAPTGLHVCMVDHAHEHAQRKRSHCRTDATAALHGRFSTSGQAHHTCPDYLLQSSMMTLHEPVAYTSTMRPSTGGGPVS